MCNRVLRVEREKKRETLNTVFGTLSVLFSSVDLSYMLYLASSVTCKSL